MKHYPISLLIDQTLKYQLDRLQGYEITTVQQFRDTPKEKLIEYLQTHKIPQKQLIEAIEQTYLNIQNLELKLHTPKQEAECLELDQPTFLRTFLHTQQLYEILGPSGSGKTTLLLKILLNIGCKVILMDCDGTFSIKRLKQLVDLSIADFNMRKQVIIINILKFLDNFLSVQIKDHTNLKNVPYQLRYVLNQHKAKIIIIKDLLSVMSTYVDEIYNQQHFRFEVHKELYMLAKERNVCIIITNLTQQDSNHQIQRTPQDHYYSNFIFNKVQLHKTPNFYLSIKKSQNVDQDLIDRLIPYKITDEGIRFD